MKESNQIERIVLTGDEGEVYEETLKIIHAVMKHIRIKGYEITELQAYILIETYSDRRGARWIVPDDLNELNSYWMPESEWKKLMEDE